MTDAELEALVALGEGITEGPWFVHDFRGVSSAPCNGDITVSCDHPATITLCSMGNALTATPEEALSNARAIAAVPDLIAALTTVRKQRDELREALVEVLAKSRIGYDAEHIADVARQALSNMEGE